MKIIVGSTAIGEGGIPFREPKDLDIWCTSDDIPSEKCDYKVMPNDIMTFLDACSHRGYATPFAVYIIKLSHLGWDSGQTKHSPMGGSYEWDKHKADLLYLGNYFEDKNSGLTPAWYNFYNLLVDHWKKEFGNKEFLSLDNKSDEFFNDFVDYKYDHDTLHEIVAGDEDPMYKRCLKEDKDVLISQDKFTLLPFNQQIQMFKEEITVIALERFVIPNNTTFAKAYMMSLKKTITSLTKNWANSFLVLNLKHFIRPDWKLFDNYLQHKEEKENE